MKKGRRHSQRRAAKRAAIRRRFAATFAPLDEELRRLAAEVDYLTVEAAKNEAWLREHDVIADLEEATRDAESHRDDITRAIRAVRNASADLEVAPALRKAIDEAVRLAAGR